MIENQDENHHDAELDCASEEKKRGSFNGRVEAPPQLENLFFHLLGDRFGWNRPRLSNYKPHPLVRLSCTMVDLNRQHLAFPLTRVVRQKGVPEVAKSESLRFCEVKPLLRTFRLRKRLRHSVAGQPESARVVKDAVKGPTALSVAANLEEAVARQ